MNEKIIIDGFNLAHKFPPIAQKIKSGEIDAALTLTLNQVKKILSPKVSRLIVVFDGTDNPHHYPSGHPNIKIMFSRKPETADDIIRNFIRNTDDVNEWTVVSSDNEILFTARDHGAKTAKSENFKRRIDRAGRPGRTALNPEKYNPEDVDLDYWLPLFDEQDDE